MPEDSSSIPLTSQYGFFRRHFLLEQTTQPKESVFQQKPSLASTPRDTKSEREKWLIAVTEPLSAEAVEQCSSEPVDDSGAVFSESAKATMDSAELHGSTAKSDQISSNSAMMTSVLSSPTTSFSGNTRGITSETCLAVFPAFSVARNEEKTGGNLTGGPQVLASTGSQHVCHHSAHMGPSSSSMYRPQSDGNFYQYIGQLQEHMATTQNYQHATSPQRQYFGHTNTADQHQFANSQLSGFVNYQQSRMRQYVSRMSAPSPTSRDDCVVENPVPTTSIERISSATSDVKFSMDLAEVEAENSHETVVSNLDTFHPPVKDGNASASGDINVSETTSGCIGSGEMQGSLTSVEEAGDEAAMAVLPSPWQIYIAARIDHCMRGLSSSEAVEVLDHPYESNDFMFRDHKVANAATARKRPVKTIFMSEEEVSTKRSAKFSGGSEGNDSAIIDVVGAGDSLVSVNTLKEPDIPLPYNRQRAERVMRELEKYLTKVRSDTDATGAGNGAMVGGGKGDRFEEDPLLKVYSKRGTWTFRQRILFDSCVKIIYQERHNRFRYITLPEEAVMRRLNLERSAARFRRLVAGIQWNGRMVYWLHSILIDGLPPAMLAIYFEILQALRPKIPELINSLLNYMLPHTGDGNNDELLLLMEKPWDPVGTSVYRYVSVWVAILTLIDLIPFFRESLANFKELSELDQNIENLCFYTASCPMVSLRPAAYRGRPHILLHLPVCSMLDHQIPKFPKDPLFIIAPHPYTKIYDSVSFGRIRGICRFFSQFGAVLQVDPKSSSTVDESECYAPAGVYKNMLIATRDTILDLHKMHPQKALVLVGFGIGSMVACQSCLLDGCSMCSAVLCFGFPLKTPKGFHGEYGDPLLRLCPSIQFFIGLEAGNCPKADFVDFRNRLECYSDVVFAAGCDDYLRMKSCLKFQLRITQSIVDRCLLDETVPFLLRALCREPVRRVDPPVAEALTKKRKMKSASRSPNTSFVKKVKSSPEIPFKISRKMDAALLTASESMSSSYSSNSQSQSSSTEIQILDGSIQNVPVKPAACIQMEFRTMSPQRASTGALTLPGTLAFPDRGGDINQAIHMPGVQMEPWQMDFSDGYITGPVSVARDHLASEWTYHVTSPRRGQNPIADAPVYWTDNESIAVTSAYDPRESVLQTIKTVGPSMSSEGRRSVIAHTNLHDAPLSPIMSRQGSPSRTMSRSDAVEALNAAEALMSLAHTFAQCPPGYE